MKHLVYFRESLKGQKLNTYDFGDKSVSSDSNIPKKDYAGSLLHWRRVYPEHIVKREDSMMYQFAWIQKKVSKPDSDYPTDKYKNYKDYPDFNYGTNAMACNLTLGPSWDKKGKFAVHIYFDSADDDIMYEGWKIFDSLEEGKRHVEIVKKEFIKAFMPAYKSKSRIYDATLPIMETLFEIS